MFKQVKELEDRMSNSMEQLKARLSAFEKCTSWPEASRNQNAPSSSGSYANATHTISSIQNSLPISGSSNHNRSSAATVTFPYFGQEHNHKFNVVIQGVSEQPKGTSCFLRE